MNVNANRAHPPRATVKTVELAAVNAQNKPLHTPPGQAVKELNADRGSKLGKLGKHDFTEQLAKKIEKLMNAYKHIAKPKTVDQESGIFRLSN